MLAETDGAVAKRGRKKGQNNVEIDAMMVFAVLAERAYDAEPKPAARAAILAFYTWIGDPHPERKVDERFAAVQKAVQRFKRGERDIEGTIARIAFEYYRQTGERWTGTTQEIAANVATFLPRR